MLIKKKIKAGKASGISRLKKGTGVEQVLNRCSQEDRDQRKEEREKKNTPLTPKGGKTASEADLEMFEKFWALWPDKSRRSNRANTLKKWKSLKMSRELFTEIMEGLEHHLKCEGWIKERGDWIPGAVPWLNQNKWTERPKKKIGFAKDGHDGLETLDTGLLSK